MSRTSILSMSIIVCLIVISSGCRNRCGGPFGSCYSDGTTIAPPPTGTLQIPSISKNQPYYSPGNSSRTALNTQVQAPLPGPVSSGTTGNQLAQTRFVETQSATIGFTQPGMRTASLSGTGTSYSRSTDYRTTRTDERSDSTRLALTDASTVRAPSHYYTAGAGAYPAQQTYVARNQGYPTGPVPFSARGVLVNPALPAGPNVYRGQAVMVGPQNFGVNSRPTVVAQATTIANPGSSQFVWRDRELNSGSFR